MRDEFEENEKRLEAMDKRIQSLRRTHGLLPGLRAVLFFHLYHTL